MVKHIVVTGGVISGCGKGIAAASLALLLKQRGYSIQCIKFDPYLNINAGIMSPHEHGEVWVTDSGEETDMDLGHYFRIAGCNGHIFTSGTLYKDLMHEQEYGKWLGQTIQVIPHVTDKIINKMEEIGSTVDILISEIGGTVGDLESGAFYEAIRQFKRKYRDDCIIVMVAPILWISTISEFKSKPLQRAVIDLQTHNLQPDILLCRVDRPIPDKILDKVSNLTNVPREAVFDAPDANTIYQVPLEFYKRHIDDLIIDMMRLKRTGCRIHKYRDIVEKHIDVNLPAINIGIFGKYNNCSEAYVSLKESLTHAGASNEVSVNVKWIIAEELETCKDISSYFEDLDGIIVPGGFDSRGVEGKIKAIQHARKNKVPFLGICLGLQCAVIEAARHECNLELANSIEFDANTPHPVIYFVEGQEGLDKKSGTMRLGAYDCEIIDKKSWAAELYGKKTISERHRHRFEVNNKYEEVLSKGGLHITGVNPQSKLIEIMEMSRGDHPFFVGTQAHPEFKSQLVAPAPLFHGLISVSKALKYG